MAARTFASRRFRLASGLAVAAAVVVGGGTPALAHRDGCHAQHSCPSDNGTYVCGDTGNFSECGIGSGGQNDDSSSGSSGGSSGGTPAPVDDTAPGTPAIGGASVRAGKVSVPVTAESGSRIEVSDGSGRTVATASATGGEQTVTFRGRDGAQTYTVTATDSAGNTSFGDTFSVNVDGTAPKAPAVKLTAATGRAAYSDIAIIGERGARYVVKVSDKAGTQLENLTQRGSLDDGEDTVRLLAPNGEYEVDVLLTDRAGNISAATTSALAVALPAPTLELERTSSANDANVVMQLVGPALGKGAVEFTAAGQDVVKEDFTLDDSGRTVLRTHLPDATWAATGAVVDFQQRKAAGRSSRLLIDTVAPVLLATLNPDRAEDRTIAVAFDVEPNTVVTVSGAPGGELRYDRAGPQTLVRKVDDGDYRLTLVATDEAGNVTTQRLSATVTHPLTLAEGLTAAGVLGAVAAGGFFAMRSLWRRRDGLGTWVWDRRAKKAQRQILASHARNVAAHAKTVAAHGQAVAEHSRTQARWDETTTRLRAELAEAKNFEGTTAGHLPVKAKPAERLFSRSEGGLVEIRKPRGGVESPTVIESGTVFVTSHRVLFAGLQKSREWSFEKMLTMSHVGAAMTLMQVTNRQKPSGVTYEPAPGGQVRRRLELALGAFEGRRAELVTGADEALKRHLERPPTPPVPPPAAPVDPVLPTADDLRNHVGKTRPSIPKQRSGNVQASRGSSRQGNGRPSR
jgi:hypothetical protein